MFCPVYFLFRIVLVLRNKGLGYPKPVCKLECHLMVRKQTADNDKLIRDVNHRQRHDVSVKKAEEGPSKLSGIKKKTYCLINIKKGNYKC